MLTTDEKKYLEKISKTKKVRLYPYDPKVKVIAEKYISQIKKAMPEPKIYWIGASALGIFGQKDIDINILCSPKEFDKYLPKLKKILSQPKSTSKHFIEWNFKDTEYDVEIYLTNPESQSLQRQIKVFELLKSNKKLLKEYETLKNDFDGQSYHDYQKAKYEFYNKIIK